MTAFLLGVAAAFAVAFALVLVADADLRRAAGEVALAFLVGPALLFIAVVRRGPRAKRVSPEALEWFARMQGPGGQSAWLLSYGGRGILFVRRRGSERGWVNNVPSRMNDAANLPERGAR